MSKTYPELYPGDIGAVRGSGPLLWTDLHTLKAKDTSPWLKSLE